jgi:hypothetical protein
LAQTVFNERRGVWWKKGPDGADNFSRDTAVPRVVNGRSESRWSIVDSLQHQSVDSRPN